MENTLKKGRMSKISPVMISVTLAILSGACFTRTIDQYNLSGQVGFEAIVFYIPIGLLALLGAVMLQLKTRHT